MNGDGQIPVPRWVAYVTYLLCWGFAGYLFAGPAPKTTPVLVAAVFLLLFPVAGFKPMDVARDIVRGGRE